MKTAVACKRHTKVDTMRDANADPKTRSLDDLIRAGLRIQALIPSTVNTFSKNM